MSYFDRAQGAFPSVCFEKAADITLVLGSGWGDALTVDRVLAEVPYAAIPGFGQTTVLGHAGLFRLYERQGKRIAAFCGRRHPYEGVGWEAVCLPVEMARRMHTKMMLLTNAVGGLDAQLAPGDFMVITDHVNLSGENPLRGEHNSAWGVRFPDMTEVYARNLQQRLSEAIAKSGVSVHTGIYAYSRGPVFETPAEVRAYRAAGADVVGMSTVPEAVLAHACGIPVAALACVTNHAAGIGVEALDHEKVMAAAARAKPTMRAIVENFICG